MYKDEDVDRPGKRLVHRVALEDVDEIPKEGVLFIVVSQLDPDMPRLNGRRRMAESHSHDRYALIVKKEWFLLYGWDDGDYEWKRHAVNPWAEASTTIPDHLPLSPATINFEGSQLGDNPESPEWLAAVDQFNKELH